MKKPHSLTVDLLFIALSIIPAMVLAASGSLKDAAGCGVLVLTLTQLLTLVAPLRLARGRVVPRPLYSACRLCFFVLSVVLTYLGTFVSSMALLVTLFPPRRMVDAKEVHVMPTAQAFGAIISAGAFGTLICWLYFRRHNHLWKRLCLASNEEPHPRDD